MITPRSVKGCLKGRPIIGVKFNLMHSCWLPLRFPDQLTFGDRSKVRAELLLFTPGIYPAPPPLPNDDNMRKVVGLILNYYN